MRTSMGMQALWSLSKPADTTGCHATLQASDYQAYPWTAHDIGGWVAEVAGVKAAKIDRPSFVTHWTFPFVVCHRAPALWLVSITWA